MPSGLRLLLVGFLAGTLASASTPAAEARSGGPKAPRSTPAAKSRALVADVARIEPLPAPGRAAPTAELRGVGEYRGVIEVRRAGAGVGAVNEVALDDYLKGISEVPSGWPPEALRAQAIAARTYLLWVLGRGPAGEAAALGAQICATESCQVYRGVAKERAPSGGRWSAAVGDTAGLALLSGGSPILAKYSACNGGRSVSGGKPYLRAVDDPDDARCPLHRWGLTVSYDDLGRALGAAGPVRTVRATPADVVVEWDGAGGGGEVTVPRTEFRAKVGAAVPPPPDRSRTVPSIRFSLRPDDTARVAALEGRGYGHGIGLSQWGAYGKAQRGMKAAGILAAYYGGIRPTRIPSDRLPARVRVAVDGGRPAPKPGAASPPGRPAGGKPAPAPPPGRKAAVVSASGPFRIVDAKGRVVVPVATGTWKVVPAGRGVRLVPPRDQAGAPGVTVLGVEPARPLPGQALTLRYRSNLPALVSVTAQPPGDAAVPVLTAQVVGTEERRLDLPPAARPGTYTLTVTADSGSARSATRTFTEAVADPATPAQPPGSPGGLFGAIPAALHQTLVLADDLAWEPASRPIGPRRASRSSSLRTARSPAPAGSGSSGSGGLGVVMAALAGLALWAFRARPPTPIRRSSSARSR